VQLFGFLHPEREDSRQDLKQSKSNRIVVYSIGKAFSEVKVVSSERLKTMTTCTSVHAFQAQQVLQHQVPPQDQPTGSD
jgi:hypothetical protein